MSIKRTIRVLIVDDSAHNRRAIADILTTHPDIEVVGTADDGEKALKLVPTLKPDLITLDLEMPRMDGFTFLRILMQQMPTPVIVISSQSHKQQVFQVLELGALDFVGKPTRFFSSDEPGMREELVAKVLAARMLQMVPFARRAANKEAAAQASPSPVIKPKSVVQRLDRLVCIGASTGGPPALQAIFKAVSDAKNTAFVVAQHMPEKFTRAFAERLNRVSTLHVQEADEGMLVVGGAAYIAPGGAHLKLVHNAQGLLACSILPLAQADRYAPSVDVLFESATAAFKGKILAVVLTGMGSDGSLGVRAVHKGGGRVMAESAESAIVYGMPKEAVQTGCVHESLPIEGIAESLGRFARGI